MIVAVLHNVVASIEAVSELTFKVCIAREFYAIVVVSFPIEDLDKAST